MDRVTNNNYMYNLELQSLHYWYKHAPLQNQSFKYNNIMKIMQNTIYKTDIIDISSQEVTKSHISYYDREILKNVFEHWKMYVVHKLHTRRATYKANYFYYKKLQKKVLYALSKNVLLKWKHIVSCTDICTNKLAISLNCKKAEVHCRKVLLRQYFTCWCKYIAIRLKETTLLEKAITFYNSYCLNKFIMYWKVYIIHRKRKKVIQDRADEVYKLHLKKILQRCMRAWISICEFTVQKSQLENAVLHYKNKLFKKYFSAWTKYHDSKIEKSITYEYVQEYSKKKLVKQYFEQFIMCVKESLADKIAQANAETFNNFKCLQRGFYAWRRWYDEKVQNLIKMHEIKSIFENTNKRTAFDNWRLYVYEKKCRKRKSFLSQNFYKRKLITKYLKNLYHYAAYRKQKQMKLSYLNNRSDAIIRHLQNVYIEKWRMALHIVVQEKRKLSYAIEFWELNLSRKYFLYWKEFSQNYRMKELRKKKLNDLASDFLLKKYILHWRTKLQNILEINRKELYIISIINHKIMRKHLYFWKQYIVQKVTKRNNIDAAKELHKKFFLRQGLKEILKSTLHNIDYRYYLQLENATIRCFKKFEILKEYFDKWQRTIYLKNNAKSLHKVTRNKNFQFIPPETSYNIFNSSKNVSLVLPEYMKKKNSIPTVSDSFVTLPLENWSCNFFQLH